MQDFHSHLIPGVDDGASDLAEARKAMATMIEQGVTGIVATPHISASLVNNPAGYERYLALVDESWKQLTAMAEAEFPSLRLDRGMEVMLDIPNPDLSDPRLHLANSPFVLVEFPYMNIPPRSGDTLRWLVANEVRPIVAHPERYRNISGNEGLIEEWHDAGAGIQINCGSLIGRYGATAKRVSWLTLQEGWADYVASDYHSRGRCPIAECRETLEARGGSVQWNALAIENPEQILVFGRPQPVPPLQEVQRRFWHGLFNRA